MDILINIIKYTKTKVAYLLLIALVASSCESYLDVNEDTDAIQENPGVYLLPSIQISIGSIIGGTFALHGSLWCQYYNQNNTANQYRNIIDMLVKANDGDNMWDELFSSALSDIQKLKEYSNATETYDPRLNLIATVLESYTFQVIYDAYGQAPYTEAFEGEIYNFNPGFENGEDIYPVLVTAMDDAIEEYATFLENNPDEKVDLRDDQLDKDLFFLGDMADWISFANSVKLKIAVRNLDYAETWATGIINSLETSADYIAEDVVLDVFKAEVNKENPLYAQDQNLNTTINLVANKTLSGFWTNNGDPREELTYKANSAGNNLLEHGDHKATTATNPPNSNRLPILSATRPVYFLTTSEVDFFRAELVVRGVIAGNAKALYDQAVMDAFDRVGSSAVTADTGFLAVGKNYEFSADMNSQLQDIGVQKWAALANVNPFEGFLEVNRMDYPVIANTSEYVTTPVKGNTGAILYLPKNTVLGSDYIKRYLLPESEAVSNANFPGQTKVTDKLWWDTK